MVWVKGELLTDIDASAVDPSGQLERIAQPSLFDRRDWFRRLWLHDGGIPLIARVTSEGSIAWLFLRRESGGNVTSIANWYSFSFRPVYAGNPDISRKRAMLTAAAKRLRQARPSITAITLNPVPTHDGSADLVSAAFRKAGWSVHVDESSVNWTADVAGISFEEYWAARPGHLRSTHKRKSAKAEFETQVLTRFDEIAWSDYEAIYAESWKPEEGSPDFLKSLAQAEGAAGTLRLGLCRVDGEPVAAQFWTVENGTALIHKLAYKASAADLSPGTILSATIFRHVIDVDRVDRIDFGTGDDPYKADWMDMRSPLCRIQAFNTGTAVGLAGAGKAALSRLVRRNAGR